MESKKTYLIEIMYWDNHNTEEVEITTNDINWSMNQYQRNRRPFQWEILDWKLEKDTRQLEDERIIDA